MIKTATTIEQGKKLLELDIDPKTADCNWNTTFGEWAQCIGKNSFAVESGLAVPAWSLSALLEVMPISIKVDGLMYTLRIQPSGLFSTHSLISKWTMSYSATIYKGDHHITGRLATLVSIKNHDPIDAAFELIVWLLENNLIKQ